MTDREMLMLALGALQVTHGSIKPPDLEIVLKLIIDHLYPQPALMDEVEMHKIVITNERV